MLKVNLLPADLGGKKKVTPTVAYFKMGILTLFFLNLIFLALGIYFRIQAVFKNELLSRLSQKYDQAQGLKKAIEETKKDREKIKKEIALYKQIFRRDILWSEKLDRLRDFLPAEIWFKQVIFDKIQDKGMEKSKLTIKGGVLPRGQETSLTTLSVFINKIKSDQDFFSNFDNLLLADFRSEKYKNNDIMSFLIEMPFKPR
ncbi:MAG: hypothetical protein ABIH27_03175 [Candidatus Omnitrophota bacterium]